ncbi:unnamed protein product [Soboliphyme baturini]|uniref:TPR_REGION domain-containing protein n=1 Tax=Soboliphyme baturini TaxID=241478 RepID=A0A183IMV8_9BILA|nr:unnamed protein product [Soboliphyme baturini]
MPMVVDYLKELFTLELFHDVVALGSFVSTICEKDESFLNARQKYEALVYQGRALYALGQYKMAETVLSAALALCATFEKRSDELGFFAESETIYYVHLSLVKQQKYMEAIDILEEIPKKRRSPKVKCALASLYKRFNMSKLSAECYMDLIGLVIHRRLNIIVIIDSCPFAIGSLQDLLSIETSEESLRSLISQNTVRNANLVDVSESLGGEWFNIWVNALAFTSVHNYASALNLLQQLDKRSVIAGSPPLLYQLSVVYYNMGETTLATTALQRLHAIEPLQLAGMDTLALLLHSVERSLELESLASDLLDASPDAPETLVAMGYLCLSLKRPARALYFAQRTCEVTNPPCASSMLLKGQVLIESEKWNEAISVFHQALLLNPCRYEFYDRLVFCQLKSQQYPEAKGTASACLKLLGQTARPLTLYGSVLLEKESGLKEAQRYLEKAVSMSPHPLNAVYLLANAYEKQGLFENAINLLQNQTNVESSCALYEQLGDLFSRCANTSEAIDSYQFALTLEPNNSAVASKLNALIEVPSSSAAADSNLVAGSSTNAQSLQTTPDST